jgi:hypothetical protein
MSLANPSELACFAEDGKTINVIVETPKGSRNKFAFDEKQIHQFVKAGVAAKTPKSTETVSRANRVSRFSEFRFSLDDRAAL